MSIYSDIQDDNAKRLLRGIIEHFADHISAIGHIPRADRIASLEELIEAGFFQIASDGDGVWLAPGPMLTDDEPATPGGGLRMAA